MFLLNSLLRTGKVENDFSTVTVVPTYRAVFLSLILKVTTELMRSEKSDILDVWCIRVSA
jgi:hypothetical protein